MDEPTFDELQEKTKWLEREYREVCNTCHEVTQKYNIGLGGEKVDQIVARYVDQQAARIAEFESLLREITDEPPIVVSDGGACCVFCGAAYDNPHTDDCWVTRVEKAIDAKGDAE